jgi:UDP-GlcNAc:undecaprenyl-phosphate GlcNAc-1-phosphate transferase
MLLMLLAAAGVYFFQDPLHYPWLTIEVRAVHADPSANRGPQAPGLVKVSFLGNGVKSAPACRQKVVEMTNTLRGKCPTCDILELDCLHPPSPERRSYLSNEPSEVPVVVHPGGVVVYESSDMSLAVSTCLQSEIIAAGAQGVRCLPMNTPKAASWLTRGLATLPYFAIFVALVGTLAAWLSSYLLVRYEHLHGRFSLDFANSGPQKVHTVPTPRVGGVSLIIALLLVSLFLQNVAHRYGTQEYSLLLMAAMPAFVVGLAEDVTKKVGVPARLGATMLAALLGSWLLGANLVRLDMPGLQSVLQWTPVAIVLTAVAVGGVANAFNIIDGYNGLAAGTAVIASAAMGWVAWWVGDPLVMSAAFAMAGALLGFLAWNWPSGRIFLGDGGAYLVGFWLAELAVILVARNPSVSAWFPMAVLIYPVFETLFSIARRTRLGRALGAPDASHLHQLVYRHICRRTGGSASSPVSQYAPDRFNGKVARHFWWPNLALAVLAAWAFQNTLGLLALVLVFCLGYTVVYRRLSRTD